MAASQPQDHHLELQPRRRSRRWVIASAALAGITVVPTGLAWAFGPGGYLGENARKLRALENDPMGAETILGHTAFHTERARLPGWLEKTTSMYLRRYFQTEQPPAAFMQEFITHAEGHGWTKDEKFSSDDLWSARHTERDSDDYMHLGIAMTDEDSYAPSNLQGAILVILDYR
ncbi:hypothetical protein [Actinomyces capricornis]|uniref:Uncharacterized protein n=1 Tax=Actinomyces capricornis TaxID=2755559 RepID=A0ABM7U8P1_9ACTO|nr:hypothetical protein [Actinomyces capricornis]BDA63797.1 hypothetical protein MANAM107_06310 [Actinomyces capricornis]